MLEARLAPGSPLSPGLNERKRKKLERKLRNKLLMLKWRAIRKALRNQPIRELGDGSRGRVVCMGSRTMLCPSEKYFCAESDRRTELEKQADDLWAEKLQEHAVRNGLETMVAWVEGEPIVFAVLKVREVS